MFLLLSFPKHYRLRELDIGWIFDVVISLKVADFDTRVSPQCPEE